MIPNRWRGVVLGAISVLAISSEVATALEADLSTRYTWMLPKTVLDVTLAYSFQDCTDTSAKFKITPTLAERPIADLRVGQKSLSPEAMQSFQQDKSISLQTFAGSQS